MSHLSWCGCQVAQQNMSRVKTVNKSCLEVNCYADTGESTSQRSPLVLVDGQRAQERISTVQTQSSRAALEPKGLPERWACHFKALSVKNERKPGNRATHLTSQILRGSEEQEVCK